MSIMLNKARVHTYSGSRLCTVREHLSGLRRDPLDTRDLSVGCLVAFDDQNNQHYSVDIEFQLTWQVQLWYKEVQSVK